MSAEEETEWWGIGGKQFGVTRSAIRTILAKLESQHVITRHRGSGTFLVERARV